MNFVYILLCDQKTYYVGVTSNLGKRLKEHRSKLSFYTKQFSGIEFVYSEIYRTLVLARRREKHLKGGHTQRNSFISRKRDGKISTGLAEVLQDEKFMVSLPNQILAPQLVEVLNILV